MNIRDFTELRVYNSARDAAMRIYVLTRSFPREEQQSLTAQIRRSSRSVCANIAEGWPKRRYPAAFRAKIVDAAGEADETRSWLDLAYRCGFLASPETIEMTQAYRKIAAQLIRMSSNPEQWKVR